MSRPLPRRVLVLIVAAGFLLAGVGGALVAFWVQAYEARETVAEVCAEREAEGGSECTDEQLRGEPGAKGEKGDPGENATPDQVYAAVEQYMATHEVFDPALLRQFVADYLAAHPPADGKDATPITPAQLFATVATYLQANPPAPGEKGEKGDPGETPTTEELLDLLRVFLAENPDAICATGYTLTELRQVNLADGQLYEFLTCARPVE